MHRKWGVRLSRLYEVWSIQDTAIKKKLAKKVIIKVITEQQLFRHQYAKHIKEKGAWVRQVSKEIATFMKLCNSMMCEHLIQDNQTGNGEVKLT